MMEFEKAIHDASTLFLFDLRSQHRLQEWAEAAAPRSRDRTLLRLSLAAFTYYNAVEAQVENLHTYIKQASDVLNEVKRFREDRVVYTMALRMEVDLLMSGSLLKFLESPPGQERVHLFNEADRRALSICESLLRNLPTNFDPLPNTWYTSLIPLFPPFQDQTLLYYRDRVKDNRIVALAGILRQLRRELVAAAGVIQAKQFVSEHKVKVRPPSLLRGLFRQGLQEVLSRAESDLPHHFQLSSDITLPKQVALSELDAAMTTVEATIDQSKRERDVRKYTGSLLHLGILNFLRGNHGRSVQALVHTLRASKNIDPQDKKLRMHRHEEFSDIPFMIGTNFLRHAMDEEATEETRAMGLQKSKGGLMQALVISPDYHQAYVNLCLAVALEGKEDPRAVIDLYMSQFDNDLSQINPAVFRNLGLLESQEGIGHVPPSMVKWLMLSKLCSGGEMTDGRKMLQELKTLYILNAHEYSAVYLETYRSALRTHQESFIEDLKNDNVHSAILFHIAHAHTYLSLAQGKDNSELKVDLDKLDQGIDLNSEALYFNRKNPMAERLVETQSQLLVYLSRRAEQRWDNINVNIGQRFQLYEDFLRQERTYGQMKQRLAELKLESLLPEIQISQAARLKMDGVISEDQRKRIRDRVMAG
ncbi:MAG: hypothetical protein IIA41_04665 [SAR324 cluster bacterium]|nr:hypothetical protein [SAR324 cluster bacterium]